MTRYIVFLSTFFFFSTSALGQNRKEQLQKQSAELKKQIANINAEIAKSKKESRISVAYLDNVNRKIQLREQVYQNTQKEKKFIEEDIYLKQLEINRQNRELEVLRKNYKQVLINAYKNRDVNNKVTFILSSKSFGQAIRRVQYLRNYSDYQTKQADKITKAKEDLQKAIASKEKSVNEKQALLKNQQKELITIQAEREEKARVVEEFKQNEKKLVAELQQKQAQQRSLEGQIRAIIAEEIRLAKANEEARKKEEAEKRRIAREAAEREKARIDAENKARAAALEKQRKAAEAEAKRAEELMAKKAAEEKKRAENAARAEATAREIARREAAAKEAAEAAAKAKAANEKLAAAKAAEAELEKKKEAEKKAAEAKTMTDFGVTTSSASFAASKGKLSMPAYGRITHRFGRQPHPVFKNIWEENHGIKIAVSKGTAAKCVFPGVVSRILDGGDGTRTVVVKHDGYFTTYGNLASTSVKQNQKISGGTVVGVVGEDFEGTHTLEFQIWNGTTPVDPMGWIN
ncbi:peptidoglycan DD-metalloendopeptidase family protein [Bergeyella zoohelcum]|uniref:murein hydrolase activator EnvC family protein n=1 Tax=Bergeyella zoohelcum TaxID=1015 RepID=UPI002A910DB1|nr:peptidoglycan DD-metalloendopeptidase family protein [Bergeyella zoohelcum]MDY6026563.1 peptidoglycan DD-metalloendopeptidase family protein [Bergeyella zoohelcum]